MKLFPLTILPLVAWFYALVSAQSSLKTFNDDLQFDNYTLILKGQRIFLHSGEFHTFRLPVPSLWPDILEKVKAAGFNGISVYLHMGLINPSPGVMDFDGYRSVNALYEAARAAGIWIVLRAGPYINGETTAGGLPHWTTTQIKSELRTTAPDWNAAWIPYIQAIIGQTNQSQISNGGPVIAIQVDNEYDQQEGGPYFAEIEALYKDPSSGINVPLTHNDPGMLSGFINGTGAVDLYGMDAYPQGLDPANLSVWSPIEKDYHSYHEQVNPSQPWYSPEFQSGAFDGWGPGATGYEDWRAVTDADFVSVFYQHTWASNAKLVNYYMLVGGTSWGALPYPGVYTSYDYGAAITEARMLTRKYTELKLQGTFLRSSREFYKTDWIGTSASGLKDGAIVPSNPPTSPAFVTLLRNFDTGAGFWIVRQNDSTSLALSAFKLNVTVASGEKLTIPLVASSIRLDGRESKTLTTDYAFGSSSRALYSTAVVFFAGSIDGRDILFLYGDSDQEHEVALKLTGNVKVAPQNNAHIQVSHANTLPPSTTIVTVNSGFQGLAVLYESDTQMILFADKDTVSTFWAPTIATDSSDPFANYWSIGTNETVLVGGPYLVRSAELGGGGRELVLRGDLNATSGPLQGTSLTLIAPSSVTSLTWNGESVSLSPLSGSASGIQIGHVPGDVASIKVPNLEEVEWKFNDSLPEVNGGFVDEDWVVANHTTTNIPFPMNYGDGRILYGCDYGFCENVVLWRGHFNATGEEKSVNLSVNGGAAFAASVWLNDQFLNTTFGNSTNNANVIEETDEKYLFPPGSLRVGQDNVITIVQDNMGVNEAKPINDDAKSPRGVRGFQLNTGNFSEWKVQGKVGGYTNYLDKVRGVLNEGGLFGERKGWHLPGFDTSSWQSRKLSDGLPSAKAGVGFFVATFELDMPSGYDIPMSFTFSDPLGQPYRLYMFVNGWMMGKRVANLGPQAKFPVHEGILNYHGENTVAIALWAMTPDVPIAPQLQLVVDGVFKGGVNVTVNNPPWSPEGRE
ncbi:glycoside hydrolase family 35 protein [Collybiopsis luxurians FD-317 M1]|nr:glycoside hydrolase family 35 protein [Collybiopsis luxurians FD-317 M1]